MMFESRCGILCGECPDFPCEMLAAMETDQGYDSAPRLAKCREWAKEKSEAI